MARVLKRHKSTIFREIKPNFWADDAFPKKYTGYFGMAAHQRTQQRRSTQRKLIRHPELCRFGGDQLLCVN
jgi:IS30 family transposase